MAPNEPAQALSAGTAAATVAARWPRVQLRPRRVTLTTRGPPTSRPSSSHRRCPLQRLRRVPHDEALPARPACAPPLPTRFHPHPPVGRQSRSVRTQTRTDPSSATRQGKRPRRSRDEGTVSATVVPASCGYERPRPRRGTMATKGPTTVVHRTLIAPSPPLLAATATPAPRESVPLAGPGHGQRDESPTQCNRPNCARAAQCSVQLEVAPEPDRAEEQRAPPARSDQTEDIRGRLTTGWRSSDKRRAKALLKRIKPNSYEVDRARTHTTRKQQCLAAPAE